MRLSLQLTYLSVKAFSAFGHLARDEHRSLTVSLATSGMELTDTLELRPGSPPASLVLPSLPTKVELLDNILILSRRFRNSLSPSP